MSTPPEPAASQHHSDCVNKTQPMERNAVVTPITQQDSTKTTSWYLARRLQVAFNDLGLIDHLPPDWLQPGPDGLSFRALSVREADQLTLAVEDLALGRLNNRPSAGTNQLPLF